MQLLDMMTINEEAENNDDVMEIVWKAFDYFPEGVWEGIKYVGNVKVKHDLKIKIKEKVYGAFIFNHLITKIKEIRGLLESENLVLALTHDPVITVYHRLEEEGFKRIVNLVRDYVSRDAGLVSLFETEEETATKIAAHGLGHNQGLEHHAKPVDLMYARLLNGNPIERDGFCIECKRKLRKRI